jgi:RNA polymerase sigma factor (sigma-70 family)
MPLDRLCSPGTVTIDGKLDTLVTMSDVTRILSAIDPEDPKAANKLLPLVYDELRRLAAAQMGHESPGQTLDATGLVHEAYLRLVGTDDPSCAPGDSNEPVRRSQQFANRRHFFAAAAEAMRRILIENARRKGRHKRGGRLIRKDLDVSNIAAPELSDHLLALDEALNKLAATDARAGKLVQLRYFAGLSIDQAAEILAISPRTADRLWAYARAWLHTEIYE